MLQIYVDGNVWLWSDDGVTCSLGLGLHLATMVLDAVGALAGIKAECYLFRVAVNSVWSHMARELL